MVNCVLNLVNEDVSKIFKQRFLVNKWYIWVWSLENGLGLRYKCESNQYY